MYKMYKMQYYDKTNYPEIFSNTYWGQCDYDEQTKEREKNLDEIFTNRNNFIINYKIKKYKTNQPQYLLKHIYKYKYDCQPIISEYDHVEFYETMDNTYIIVISPYNDGPECDEKLNNLGWTKINNLYSFSGSTYIKFIPKK